MTIEKLPSGKYRVVQMVNGKRYRTPILDHEPKEKEAQLLIAEALYKKGISVSADMPLKRACELYIESKSNVLSPSTIRRYYQYVNGGTEAFLSMYISKITKPMFQTEINSFSSTHAPKTSISYASFISSVLTFYGNPIDKITLPQKEKKEPYIPSEEEVKMIFRDVKGSPFEIPILLSAMGLRRSEVCALTLEDLSGNTLTINKALVQNEKKEWVIKPTKTTDSTRTVVIPDYVADLIRNQGYVYKGFPGSIYNHLQRTQKKLGIPSFPLHKMRHFFASYMHDLGYSDKQIQAMGGWKTDNVMKTVYTHAMNMEQAKQKAAADMSSLM